MSVAQYDCHASHAIPSNAHDLVDDYWARNKKDKRLSGRKSIGAASGRASKTKGRTSSIVRGDSSEVEEVRPNKRGKPPKTKRDELVEDEAEDIQRSARGKTSKRAPARAPRGGQVEDAEGFVSMNPWKNSATWEHVVEKIDTVERADNGHLMIYFTL